jgi:uncharacterized membrane protein
VSRKDKETPMSQSNLGDVIAKAVAFGIAGWVAENALSDRDRYSAVFRGHRVPFLPVYAVGGVAMTSMASFLEKWPLLARGLAYAAVGTTVEYVGCQIDRKLLQARSWDYGQRDTLARSSDGCVNFAHSALWGGLGLIAEKFR